MELWCSNNPYPDKGTLLDTQYTNSIGWYGLTVDRDACEYYHIIQTNLAGYVSDGATTVSGVVKTADWIQYQGPLAGKTLTGNTTLNIVPVDDTWDPACLEYAHAYPSCTCPSS